VKALVVSGLWPPDIGGPASHAPEVCEWLLERGHGVTVVTLADRSPDPRPYPVHWISRRLPPGVRHAAVAAVVARLARRADVVYSIAILGRTSLGASLAGTPYVVKLTTDPVFERSLHWRLAGSNLASFQDARGLRIGALRIARDRALAGAARVVVSSHALSGLASSWGVSPEKTELLPNPIAPPYGLPTSAELRDRYGMDGPTLVYAGRLVPQKSVDVALEAVQRNDAVSLIVAGEGPDRELLETRADELGLNDRARFLGAQPRQKVFELLRAADAAILSSSWENFPHLVVEALCVGTPVLATAAGGVGEIVRHESNGLLAPVGDADALGAAIARYLGDAELRDRLRAGTTESVAAFAPRVIFPRLERLLEQAAQTQGAPRARRATSTA
jgi:glycosyltransferase involved in cell wall biosynthesis